MNKQNAIELIDSMMKSLMNGGETRRGYNFGIINTLHQTDLISDEAYKIRLELLWKALSEA